MVIMTALSLMLLLFQFKRGIFAPSTVFGVIAGLNILVFYLVVVYSYFPDYLADWWQIKNLVNYKSTVNFVTLYYLSLLLISILINNLTSKNVKDKSKKKNFIDFNKIKIESVITRYFVSYSMVWLLFCINLLFILHFSQVDFNSLLHYNQYLLVRIPEKVNIHNEFIAFIHKIIPVIGIIIAPMVVLFYRRKVILLFILSIIPLIYCYLIVISFNSRFSSVYTFIIAIMIIITNKKRKINLPVILLVVLGMILYAASIKLRFMSSNGIGDFGVIPFFKLIFTGDFIKFDNFIFFMGFNLFGGGFVLAESILRGQLSYPLKYKILSFSPLPSSIDTFKSVAEYEQRVNMSAPYSNLAEVHAFGFVYVILYFIFLVISLIILNKSYYKIKSKFFFIVYIPAYYAFLKMHAYPLRHTIKFIFISVIIACFFSNLLDRKNDNVIRPKQREGGRY